MKFRGFWIQWFSTAMDLQTECKSVNGFKKQVWWVLISDLDARNKFDGFSQIDQCEFFLVQYHEVLGSLVGPWAQRAALFFNVITVGAVAVVQIIACARYELQIRSLKLWGSLHSPQDLLLNYEELANSWLLRFLYFATKLLSSDHMAQSQSLCKWWQLTHVVLCLLGVEPQIDLSGLQPVLFVWFVLSNVLCFWQQCILPKSSSWQEDMDHCVWCHLSLSYPTTHNPQFPDLVLLGSIDHHIHSLVHVHRIHLTWTGES